VQTVIENPQAHVVEGSNGLLLEIDGAIVPNYDATFRTIEEGEVVTGNVVRIDKDEVLVDIGYKSEGVIPANELSIRKSVDPKDEVHLGEEVDAIVMTKEDQDGRLIMSKKRARFEKAWRRIETAAESGEPVEGTVIEVDERPEVDDVGNLALHDQPRLKSVEDLLANLLALLLQHGAAGQHDVVAGAVELDHLRLDLGAHVLVEVRHATDVHQRGG